MFVRENPPGHTYKSLPYTEQEAPKPTGFGRVIAWLKGHFPRIAQLFETHKLVIPEAVKSAAVSNAHFTMQLPPGDRETFLTFILSERKGVLENRFPGKTAGELYRIHQLEQKGLKRAEIESYLGKDFEVHVERLEELVAGVVKNHYRGLETLYFIHVTLGRRIPEDLERGLKEGERATICQYIAATHAAQRLIDTTIRHKTFSLERSGKRTIEDAYLLGGNSPRYAQAPASN